jgi:hypothetical protein
VDDTSHHGGSGGQWVGISNSLAMAAMFILCSHLQKVGVGGVGKNHSFLFLFPVFSIFEKEQKEATPPTPEG